MSTINGTEWNIYLLSSLPLFTNIEFRLINKKMPCFKQYQLSSAYLQIKIISKAYTASIVIKRSHYGNQILFFSELITLMYILCYQLLI